MIFVREIHRWQVNSPHKGPVTLKMFLFDDVIMCWRIAVLAIDKWSNVPMLVGQNLLRIPMSA